jgi:hypothetical protein
MATARSGIVDLWGRRITVEEPYRHRYVTAIIRVRAKSVTLVTTQGELVYEGTFPVNRVLRSHASDRNDLLRTPHLPKQWNDVLPVKS